MLYFFFSDFIYVSSLPCKLQQLFRTREIFGGVANKCIYTNFNIQDALNGLNSRTKWRSIARQIAKIYPNVFFLVT